MPKTFDNQHKGKHSYNSLKDARKAVKRIKGMYGYKLDIYKCSYCNFYHLGNYSKSKSPDDFIYGGKFYESES